MTPDQAAWVRAHAWTQALRDIDTAYPDGWYGRCPCQWGICGACSGNADHGRPRHDRCISRGRGPISLPSHLTDRRGFAVGTLLTGCRYLCPCGCWNDPTSDALRQDAAEPEPARATSALPRYELVPLFDVSEVGA